MISFLDEQRSYWREADAARFTWQTRGGPIADEEAQLIAQVQLPSVGWLLEVGCGEGANLHHLAARGVRCVGVDFALAKARFAASATGMPAACADATRLPFGDGTFDAILVRDLLHHVDDRACVLAEAERVLKPGGLMTVIEPNGRNPIIAAQAAAIRAERGMLASTGHRLIGELHRAGFVDVSLERAQPMPLARVLLHYKMGVPSLGRFGLVRRAIGSAERVLERLPGSIWAYLIARGRKAA
jgi:SAM-dependent methyltransferase